jgi:hypothetical protein
MENPPVKVVDPKAAPEASTDQKLERGEIVDCGIYAMSPVNFVESTSPNVISPLISFRS